MGKPAERPGRKVMGL